MINNKTLNVLKNLFTNTDHILKSDIDIKYTSIINDLLENNYILIKKLFNDIDDYYVLTRIGKESFIEPTDNVNTKTKIVIQCGDPDKLIWASPTTFYFPEKYLLHPNLHVKFVENILRQIYADKTYSLDMFEDNTVYIITNSEHIINRFRIAKKEDPENIDILIEFNPFDSDDLINIDVLKSGKMTRFPKDFMDMWSDQLSKLI